MNENTCEYIIKQKAEGIALAKKISLALTYVAVAVLLSVIDLTFAPTSLKGILFVIILLVVAFAAFVTWRFVCIEYEVVIGGGEITFTVIYGKSISKKLLSRPLSSFSEIGEYDDGAFEEISKLSLQKDYLCVSSLSAPVIYYGIFDDEGQRNIVYFDVTERAAELLRKSNPSAFRASAKRMNKS